LKDKVGEIRKIVADAQIQDYTELYTLLYEHVETYAPNKISQAIIAIGEGQFRDGQVVDKEITFAATLHTILIS
jgi:hypothetical protein